MAYTRAQWNRFQAELPEEDRMSYEEYIASETPPSTSTATATAAVTATATATTTATATATPSATETPALSAAEIARFKAIEDAANADRENTIATARAADLAASGSSVNTDIKKGKLMGPSTDTKDGNPLEFKPITDGVRLAVFGLNVATGKPYTDAESAAVSGGYLFEGYKDLVGYRFDSKTGRLEVLNAAGSSTTTGARHQINAKGNLLARPEFLPKGVGQDEDGKYYQPGEVMPNESLAQYARRMSSIGGSGQFGYKGKNYQFDENGMFYIPGEQDMPVGFGSPKITSDLVSNNTMSTGINNISNINIPKNLDASTKAFVESLQKQINDLTKQVGTTSAANTIATEQATLAERQRKENALTSLSARFSQYGLQSLVPKIRELVINGSTESTIAFELQETEEYKKRFKANTERLKKGLAVLDAGTYIGMEDSYRQALRAYGLKQFDTDEYVSQFIANDISANELSNRIVTAVQRVQNADPAITSQLRQFYNIGQNDLVAYVLDPEQQFQKIERQVQAAEIGVAAARQGIQTGSAVAEQLAAQGVTQAEAQKGYATIADILPDAKKLSDIYGSTLEGYDLGQAEQEVFNQLASAQRKRQKLTQREIAAFGGSSGTNKTSLTTSSVGQF